MSATSFTRRIRPEAGTTTRGRIDGRTLRTAALLIGAPVLRGIAIVAHPHDTADAAATLALVDDVAIRWAIVHLLEPLSWLLLAVAGFMLLRLVSDKGRRLAAAGATLFGVGAAAIAMLVYSHGEAYLFMNDATVNTAEMHDLYAVYWGGVPLSAYLVPLHFLGAFLLAAGLFRAGSVSRIAAVVLAVSVIVPNAVGAEGSMLLTGTLGSAPIVAAMTVFALALIRKSRAEAAVSAE